MTIRWGESHGGDKNRKNNVVVVCWFYRPIETIAIRFDSLSLQV